jgi:hypothetical protein
VPEHEQPPSSLLPPAPSVKATVAAPLQDVRTTITLLATAVDELAETVRAVRRSASDESVDLRARIRELEARLLRLETTEQEHAAGTPPAGAAKEQRRKLPKRARREARLAEQGVTGPDAAAADAADVRARIARQLKNEHKQRLRADDAPGAD